MHRRTPTRRPRAERPRSAEVGAALDAVRRIVQALRAAVRDGARRSGPSTAQLFALQQIAGRPGASINDVAALTFTHQSSVSVVIERLVARGLVSRVVASHDRRRQRLAVTAAGRRALQRAPVAVQQRLIAAISELPAAERRALTRALAHLARRLAPDAATAPPPMLFEDPVGRDAGARAGPGAAGGVSVGRPSKPRTDNRSRRAG